MLSSTISGKRGDGLGAGVIEPVAGMHFEAEAAARACALARCAATRPSAAVPCAVDERVAPGAGVDLDHRRADRRRRLDLLSDRRR